MRNFNEIKLESLLGIIEDVPKLTPSRKGVSLLSDKLLFSEVQPWSLAGIPACGFNEDEYWCYSDVTPNDLDAPLSMSIVQGLSEHDLNNGWHGMQMMNVRPVTMQEVRGKVTRLFPRMYAYTHAFLHPGKSFHGRTVYLGYVNGRYTTLSQCDDPGMISDWDIPDKFGIFCCMQFYRRWQWRVSIRGESSTGISFVTNPEMSMELFKSRDLFPGAKRRTSLKNWVSAHKRTTSIGNEVIVRKHLRGNTQFSWNGLDVKIHVPQYDLEQNEKFRRN